MSESLLDRIQILEKRVQELEDERSIRELIAKYGYTADAQADDQYVELFADDGVLDLLTRKIGEEDSRAQLNYVGKQEIQRFITDPVWHHKPGFYGRSLHVMGNNVQARIEGTTAFVTSYNLTLHEVDGRLAIRSAGNNHWEFTKASGEWKIACRRRREVGSSDFAANLGLQASSDV